MFWPQECHIQSVVLWHYSDWWHGVCRCLVTSAASSSVACLPAALHLLIAGHSQHLVLVFLCFSVLCIASQWGCQMLWRTLLLCSAAVVSLCVTPHQQSQHQKSPDQSVTTTWSHQQSAILQSYSHILGYNLLKKFFLEALELPLQLFTCNHAFLVMNQFSLINAFRVVTLNLFHCIA